MISHSEGSTWPLMMNADECNGTIAQCPTLADHEDQEFLMDSEDHRRILQGGSKAGGIGYGALMKNKQACGKNCPGAYKVNPKRACLKTNYCPR